MDTLLNLEVSHRFCGVSRFVNVSRHCDTLLQKQSVGMLFRAEKTSRLPNRLGNPRLCGRLVRDFATSIRPLAQASADKVPDYGANAHPKWRALSRAAQNFKKPLRTFPTPGRSGQTSGTRRPAADFRRCARLKAVSSGQRPVTIVEHSALFLLCTRGFNSLTPLRNP